MEELQGTKVQVQLRRRAFISKAMASRHTLCLLASEKLVGSMERGDDYEMGAVDKLKDGGI